MTHRVWFWRLRRNPLRRPSYAIEAYAFLAVVLAAVAGAALAGLTVAHGVQQEYAQQRLDRHPVAAVVTQDAPETVGYAATPRAGVRWAAPDGTVRTGVARVTVGAKTGDPTTVWTDDRGALVPEPLPVPAARLQAGVTGVSVALGICAAVLIGCGITAKLVDLRRAEQWATAWAETGPRWENRNA
ncbi:hypothetical protein OG552_35495 [Streptomyces sp. NBC_01476]|uniref:Rv1733c family protein n=1 Tax=Streptomyces sp. NBC_01476 TaxID=2903881 RepID=UPI002E329A5B|nr:hypothetical protein [Streptomyces sp. NBC_01476]